MKLLPLVILTFIFNSAFSQNKTTNQTVVYRVIAQHTTPSSEVIESTSNTVQADQPFSVFAPNAFSPDNDGVNDLFFVSVKGVAKYELKIFDRWGNEIFYSTDPNEKWDGKYQGKEAPIGGYVYQLACVGDNYSEVYNTSGTIALVR